MKLYLSSQGIGERTENLLDLVGSERRTAVVANAIDHYDKHDRQTRVRKEKQTLREIGLNPEELDLRDYFDDSKDLHERLAVYGLYGFVEVMYTTLEEQWRVLSLMMRH